MNPHRIHLVDLLGATAVLGSFTFKDGLQIASALFAIATLAPVAIFRWRHLLRGDLKDPEWPDDAPKH